MVLLNPTVMNNALPATVNRAAAELGAVPFVTKAAGMSALTGGTVASIDTPFVGLEFKPDMYSVRAIPLASVVLTPFN